MGMPSFILHIPGVKNKKLSVMRNVKMIPKPAYRFRKWNLIDSSSITASDISIIPIKLETDCLLNTSYTQKVKGWYSINGLMDAASVGVNLNIPIHRRMVAVPNWVMSYPILYILLPENKFFLIFILSVSEVVCYQRENP